MLDSKIINGLMEAKSINAQTMFDIKDFYEKYTCYPHLVIIMVGNNDASEIYVRNKCLKAKEMNIIATIRRFDAASLQSEILREIDILNDDDGVHGIIVQLPLSAHIDVDEVLNRVSPLKDVDGFSISSVGNLVCKRELFIPCTAAGVMHLIKIGLGEDIAGRRAVVLGRSRIVGMPVFQLLLRKNCTVTIAHSFSEGVADICREADIVVAAVGKAEMVRGSWLKRGACVIDVGINRNSSGDLCGDVHFAEAIDVVSKITPVPRGVGPMTVAFLMRNVLVAATLSKSGVKK